MPLDGLKVVNKMDNNFRRNEKRYLDRVEQAQQALSEILATIPSDTLSKLVEASAELDESIAVAKTFLADEAAVGYQRGDWKVSSGGTMKTFHPEKLAPELLTYPGVVKTFDHKLVTELVTKHPEYAVHAMSVADSFSEANRSTRVHTPRNPINTKLLADLLKGG